MAKDDKKSKGGSNTNTLDIKSEETLQAVVLGDSFDIKFSPVTLEKPRTLLPLVNIPLLDYTLEFLASSGVQEIFVFCCAHADQIKEYIQSSRWSNLPGVSVKCMTGRDCRTTGDALRGVYNAQVIQSDFILITGDVVSNMNLQKALQVHKARKEVDKNNIMTMVFKQASPTHRTRSKQDDTVIGTNSETLQLVWYDNSPKKKKSSIPIELFKKHPSIQMRYDLIDCHIDICSPEVLALFIDNFDFADIREDFIHDILGSELLDHKLYTYVLQGEYAARVKDLRTYHSVSKDIIHRWTFPMVPDNNFMCNTTYSLSRQMIYKERGVKLFGDCLISEETVLGTGTEVGSGSRISHSIIGRNCRIGKNVKIHGSYIWDNVVIEDNAVIQSSLLCNGAIVKSDSSIGRGSIIGFNVVVGNKLILEPFSKITLAEPEEDEDDEENIQDFNMGENGKGKKWILENEPYNELVQREIDEPSDSDSDEPGSGGVMPPTKDKDDDVPEFIKFQREVRDTIRRGINENLLMENIQVEINGLKFAYIKDGLDCLAAILPVLLEHPNINTVSAKDLSAFIVKRISSYSPLLVKFSSEDNQVDLIFKIQDFCDENEQYKSVFQLILHRLYDNDVISEDAILEWAQEIEDDEEDEGFYLKKCTELIKWLKSAEEESDEESEEDSDTDSD
ncbi:hypothetical protein DICPUDRAFT_40532 [Dictyostelium purpureum]|uniref:Translation initiation factor eIF2B subunit epsilon n=1 Tax=Dictyostelium purpureum TaxID=5786 RepID=F0ZYD6_DICPU|nr:uncharacterized protein DICPUDRAFT_40532 [Dictyostelium purpureum]EGC31039.1 hypothetical protein DICPUDRAFT_40532 [Dictyostelium purpureum]|eukprot:XP_003292427.1 hypothetical protein DICPUDRAFT_40532 [Dictyostelium purpureum]